MTTKVLKGLETGAARTAYLYAVTSILEEAARRIASRSAFQPKES
jgi:hypothetical protein